MKFDKLVKIIKESLSSPKNKVGPEYMRHSNQLVLVDIPLVQLVKLMN